MFENRSRQTRTYGRRTCGLGFCFSLIAAQAWAADCTAPLQISGEFGTAAFSIAIADEPQERAQGLMHVEALPQFSGMLFIYEAPQSASFWMRNTLIPLDMLFADEDGVIRHIHANAVPLDETPIYGGEDIKYVLEINGGLSKKLGLDLGDQLSHAALEVDVTCD